MNQIRARRRQLIVHARPTADSRSTSLFSRRQRHQGDQVPNIGVEDLLIRGIRRVSNSSLLMSMADRKVLDMSEDGASPILLSSRRSDMGGYP